MNNYCRTNELETVMMIPGLIVGLILAVLVHPYLLAGGFIPTWILTRIAVKIWFDHQTHQKGVKGNR